MSDNSFDQPKHPGPTQPPSAAQLTQQFNEYSNFMDAQRRAAKIERHANYANAINQVRHHLNFSHIIPLPQTVEVQCHLPLETLPDYGRELVTAFAASHGVETDMAAANLFASMFHAARGSFRIQVEDDYSEVLTGYILVSAASGERKTATVDFFREPFVAFQDKLRVEFSKHVEEFDKEDLEGALREVKTVLRKEMSRKIASSMSLEHAASILRPKLEAKRVLQEAINHAKSLPRLLSDTPTPEALAIEMQKNGETMGIWEAEGGLWKHRLRPSQDDLFLKGFTGESFSSDTKTLGAVYLHSPVLAICSLVQPNVFDALFGNADAVGHGLVPRFLPVLSNRQLRQAISSRPSDHLKRMKAWYSRHVWKLLSIERPKNHHGGRGFHVLEMSHNAYRLLQDYQRKCSIISLDVPRDTGEGYRAYLSKSPGHAVRIAGAAHLMKHIDPQNRVIDEASMGCGIAFAEFFRENALIAFDPNARHAVKFARKIFDWIKRDNPTHFTERDAQRKVNSHGKAGQIRAALTKLEQHNFVSRYISLSGSGTVWVVNPSAVYVLG